MSEQEPETRVDPPPPDPPEPVYYMTTVSFLSVVADDRINKDLVNDAVMEQVFLPNTLSVLPGWPIEVQGAVSCETVSNASPTKVIKGFGYEASPEEEEDQEAA